MFNIVPVSFSKPFVYVARYDYFPNQIMNENFGYVPQSLVDWMAQDPDYVSKYPGIASCLPGGPAIDFKANDSCIPGIPNVLPVNFQINYDAPDLTVSSTVTIAGRGCFHPGACPTPATPGAAAVATTPVVTPEAHSQDSMFTWCCHHQSF